MRVCWILAGPVHIGPLLNQAAAAMMDDLFLRCFTSTSLLKAEHAHCRQDLFDISPLLNDAAAAMVDDSFLRCFTSTSSDPWNWNIYLMPLWLVGVVVRHGILFPLRYGAQDSISFRFVLSILAGAAENSFALRSHEGGGKPVEVTQCVQSIEFLNLRTHLAHGASCIV